MMSPLLSGFLPEPLLSRENHRFSLVHGASYHDELPYHAEVIQLAALYPDLMTFVTEMDRPTEERNEQRMGETGRVSSPVAKYGEQYALYQALSCAVRVRTSGHDTNGHEAS